jgi:hypothetical protein
MSQAGIVSSTGGIPSDVATMYVTDSGIASPSAHILNVLGAGGTTTSAPGNLNTIIITSSGGGGNSPIIQTPVLLDFTQAGVTTLFSTSVSSSFIISQFLLLCISATAPVGDNVFSLGWTAPNYDDWIPTAAMGITPDTYSNVNLANLLLVPPGIDFKVNITTPDSGTALTGYLLLIGFNI